MLKVVPPNSLILASTSPRRRDMMNSLFPGIKCIAPDVDETEIPGERPEDMVTRLARTKALAVSEMQAEAWCVGADTTVSINGKILGKPTSEADAERMLGILQGAWHDVWTGVAVSCKNRGVERAFAERSRVKMVALNKDEIKAYVATKEPMDKAGSYAIQGFGASLISEVNGSYTNVVGLDLAALIETLIELQVVRRGV
jgi:septum formation protein